MIAPLFLVAGILYMGRYQENLIRAELETLRVQTQLFAGAIAEGAVRPVQKGRPFLFARPEEIEVLIPELSRRMVRRMGEMTEDRTRLFDVKGKMVGDSMQLSQSGRGSVQIAPLPNSHEGLSFSVLLAIVLTELLELMPTNETLPAYPHTAAQDIQFYPDAAAALNGQTSATAWINNDGKIVMTAAAPVQKVKQVMAVIMLTRDGKQIELAMAQVRFDVLTAFLVAFSITVFLSLYLAGIIGRPLRKLARAAEAIRTGKNRLITIPDLSHRHDEIGELSLSLRDMTQALWDRMDMIESFAADVSHEIKNPLTSLRSAVETAARMKDPEKREKLMDIVLHDVQRLDRLISDISNASRLDAELSRDEMTAVDLGALLENLINLKRAPLERTEDAESAPDNIRLELLTKKDLTTRGNETRLAQVFENLIGNALSFSPAGKPVIVRIRRERDEIIVTVDDEGPGIPENKKETIFERFYTERPHEDYGEHSGLGLSIARQIVTAHGGQIFADNRFDSNGASLGARFTVILNAD